MQIINHGKKPLTIKNAFFRCYNCECEWLSKTDTECKPEMLSYRGKEMYFCNCPECGKQNSSSIIINTKG